MATKITQAVGDGAGQTISITTPATISVQAGDGILCTYKCESAIGTVVFSDNDAGGSNSYTTTSTQNNGAGNVCGAAGWAIAKATNASLTISVNSGNAGTAFPRLTVTIFRPAGGKTFAFDQSTSAQGTSSTPSAGSITATASGAAVCGIGLNTAVVFTQGAGWTALNAIDGDTNDEYQLLGSGGSITGNATFSASNPWTAHVLNLKETGGTSADPGAKSVESVPGLALNTPLGRLHRQNPQADSMGLLATLALSVTIGIANLVGLSAPVDQPVQAPGLALGSPASHFRGLEATDRLGQLATLSVSTTTGIANLTGLSSMPVEPVEAPGLGLGTPGARLRGLEATDQIGQLASLATSSTVGPAALTGSGALAALAVTATTGQADLEPAATASTSSQTASFTPGLGLGTPGARLRGVQATDQIGQLSTLAVSSTEGVGALTGAGVLAGLGLSSTESEGNLTGAGALSTLSVSTDTGWGELDGSGALAALGLSVTVGPADLETVTAGSTEGNGISFSVAWAQLDGSGSAPSTHGTGWKKKRKRFDDSAQTQVIRESALKPKKAKVEPEPEITVTYSVDPRIIADDDETLMTIIQTEEEDNAMLLELAIDLIKRLH